MLSCFVLYFVISDTDCIGGGAVIASKKGRRLTVVVEMKKV